MKKLLYISLFTLISIKATLPDLVEQVNITSNTLKANEKAMQHDYDAAIPTELKKVLDEHATEIGESWPDLIFRPERPQWLDGWLIKNDQDRIEGAKEFVDAIYAVNSRKVFVPRKYRYHLPQKSISYSRDNGKRTISEYIPNSHEPFTKEELKELLRVSKKAQWLDANFANVIKTVDGRIAIIDTEKSYINQHKNPSNQTKMALKALITKKLSAAHLENEAKAYIDQKHTQYTQQLNTFCKRIAIMKSFNSYFDQHMSFQ